MDKNEVTRNFCLQKPFLFAFYPKNAALIFFSILLITHIFNVSMRTTINETEKKIELLKNQKINK